MAKGFKTGGRQKGSLNQDTAHVKLAISAFVARKAEKVDALFETLCNEDPGKALQIYFGAAEYVLPKLARTEATVEHTGETNHSIKVIFGDGG